VIDVSSPSGLVTATFSPGGEMRPEGLDARADGFQLWHLTIAGTGFGDRVFKPHGVWSSDNRFFAVTEYPTPLESLSDLLSKTHILVIDVPPGLECVVAKQSRGTVTPISFEGNLLVFSREIRQAIGLRRIVEIDITQFENWRPVAA